MSAHMIEHELNIAAIRQSDRIARREYQRSLNLTEHKEESESWITVLFARRFTSHFGENRTFRPATNGAARR